MLQQIFLNDPGLFLMDTLFLVLAAFQRLLRFLSGAFFHNLQQFKNNVQKHHAQSVSGRFHFQIMVHDLADKSAVDDLGHGDLRKQISRDVKAEPLDIRRSNYTMINFPADDADLPGGKLQLFIMMGESDHFTSLKYIMKFRKKVLVRADIHGLLGKQTVGIRADVKLLIADRRRKHKLHLIQFLGHCSFPYAFLIFLTGITHLEHPLP